MLNGKIKIAVLVSGGGTNLQAILDAQKSGIIKNGEVVLVISNNEDAYALSRAANAGVKSVVIKRETDFEQKIIDCLEEHGIELIVLAGFMCILSRSFTSRYRDRIINVHPSLIPSFCGTGYYGLKVHEGVLARGVKVTGATVHFVDEGTDTGPIILQKAVEVQNGDTPQILQRRVMEQAEWQILPRAIDLIANGKVSVTERIATVNE